MKDQTLMNHFFIIMGPSGSGKTKVTEAVFPKDYKIISHTTRKKREEEQDGTDYYFETQETFERLIENNAFVEYDVYHGNYYGVGLADVFKQTAEHCAYDVLTFNGFKQIEERFGSKIIPIYFDVSRKQVESRLKIRESNQIVISERLELYDEEIENKEKIEKYDNSIIVDANQDFESVVESLRKMVGKIME